MRVEGALYREDVCKLMCEVCNSFGFHNITTIDVHKKRGVLVTGSAD